MIVVRTGPPLLSIVCLDLIFDKNYIIKGGLLEQRGAVREGANRVPTLGWENKVAVGSPAAGSNPWLDEKKSKLLIAFHNRLVSTRSFVVSEISMR